MSPKTATVGTATEDPNVSNMLQAAIATSSISEVQNTLANIKAAQEAAAALTPEELAAIAAAQAAAQQAAQDAAAGN